MHQLSLIILQHNSPKETEHCLRSLGKAWLPEKTQIIVINNGGNEANEKIAREVKMNLEQRGVDVKFFDIPNKGYPQGNNFGLQHADGEYVGIVNPDIIVKEATIKQLLEYLKAHPKVGIVAPQLIYPDGTIQDNYRVFPRFVDLIIKRTPFLRRFFPQRMRQYLMWDKEPEVNEAVDWVTGAFEIITRDCLNAVGSHDERYFLFMSDVAICRDAWAKGFQVHYVGSAKALHNDERLSSGGFSAFFKKKVLRLHVKDAITYYFHYLGKPLPEQSPYLSHIQRKDRLLKARVLSGTSAITKLQGKLQPKNPVVQVYGAQVEGWKKYEQPVIFFDTGVVGVVRNQKGQFGLMEVWRHIPLPFHKKNTFPIFPDPANLGVWSYEFPRGGIEKADQSPEDAVRRELKEEIGLQPHQIVSVQYVGNIVANTAIDVYHHKCFEVIVKDDFHFESEERVETIKGLTFFDQKEIVQLISERKLFCGITQAALLQAIER